MRKLIITCYIILVSISSLYSQGKLIKGRIIAENLENLPFASILINDKIEVGKADVNGYFEINIPITEKKIIFIFLGMEVTNIDLEDKCNEIEVILMDNVTYDFRSLKKVDRLRKKRFEKLPELRKMALDKGIFKKPNTCYKQEFIPYYRKKLK
ncbi:hypothetical protein MCERE19_04149 [Spirosomataceae bacterium]|jgi:hypothetical protein